MDFTLAGPRQFNHRVFNFSAANAFSGFFFWGSLAWYVKRYFIPNRNIGKLALFTVASYYFAADYGKVLFLPIEQEALMINNAREERK